MMKTPKKRIEELENGQSPKPILILWGDWKEPEKCRVDDAGPALAWDAAEKRYAKTNTLIRIIYGDWPPK